MCYCCSQSDEQSTFSKTTTTTTDNTNPESDTDSDSNSEQKSKPWLSRMFASDKSDPSASSNTTATGDFNAAKHFDLKNVSHDFNRPAGIAAAPGVRQSKTGRKIRWEGQESIKKAKTIQKKNTKIELNCASNWTTLNYSVLLSLSLSTNLPNYYLTYLAISY